MYTQLALVIPVLMVLVACGDGPTELPPTPMDPVVDMGTSETMDDFIALARSIRDTPSEAEALLSAAGMTGESFTEKLWEINADPEMAARYEAAMER